MKFLFPLLFIAQLVFAAPKLQNSDFMSAAQLQAAGGSADQLLNETKLWSTVLSDQFSNSLVTGSAHSIASPSLFGQFATPANPAAGLDKLYFKSDDQLYTLNSAGVETLIGAAPSAWLLAGNVGTNPGVDFLGTTDAKDLVFKTNNLEALRITATGGLQTIIGSDKALFTDATGIITGTSQLATSLGGTNHGDYTAGSVIFAGAGGTSLTENNAQFFWDNATARLFMGANTSIAGSNAGVQYSDATTANRGQFKAHSYFNGASIAGVSTLTSRSGIVGTNSSISAGQDYSKWTAQAAAATPGSAPISGTFSFKANSINALTVPSDFHIQLTNLAGTLGDRLYLTSEGLLQLPGYTTGVAKFDASGNVSSGTVDLSSNVSGVLPIINGGTSLTAVGNSNELFGTNVTATAFEHKAVTASASGALTAPLELRSNTSLVLEDPGAGTNIITVQSPTLATDWALTLPPNPGTAGYCLVTNGAGVTSWTTCAGAASGTPPTWFEMSGGVTVGNMGPPDEAEVARTVSLIKCSMRNSGETGSATQVQVSYGPLLASSTTITITGTGGLNYAEVATPGIVQAAHDYIDMQVTTTANGAPDDLRCAAFY